MSPLTPDEIADFRKALSGIDLSDDRKDALIRFVDGIAISFVAQAFGRHPVQLSLSARANSSFLGIPDHAKIGTISEHETVDLPAEGAKNDISPKGHKAP